jgi:hypothetical protein
VDGVTTVTWEKWRDQCGEAGGDLGKHAYRLKVLGKHAYRLQKKINALSCGSERPCVGVDDFAAAAIPTYAKTLFARRCSVCISRGMSRSYFTRVSLRTLCFAAACVPPRVACNFVSLAIPLKAKTLNYHTLFRKTVKLSIVRPVAASRLSGCNKGI